MCTCLGVLELLFNIPDGSLTNFTCECPTDQLWSDLGRSGNGTRDTGKLPNPVHSHISDTAREGQVVECNIEIPSLE